MQYTEHPSPEMREAIARQRLAAAQRDAHEAQDAFLRTEITQDSEQALEDAEQLASIAIWAANKELRSLARAARTTKLRHWVAHRLTR